jgi:O-antigen/teichoic acid export membrane protein
MINQVLKVREIIFSQTAKDTSTLFVGNATSSLLAIIFTLIAARLLGPEQWAMVAAVGSFMTILVAIGDLGLGSAILRFAAKEVKKSVNNANKIFKFIFTFRVITAIIVSTLVLSLSRLFAPLVFGVSQPKLVIFSVIGFFGFLLLDTQVVSFEARRNWKTASFFIALTNILRILFLLTFLVFRKVNLVTVLISFSAASVIAFFVSLFFQKVKIGITKDAKAIFKRISGFSSWMVVVASFADVLAPRYAQSVSARELKHVFKRAVYLSCILVFGLIIGIAISPLVISLFGEQYQASKIVFQLLLVALIPFSISTPAVNALIYAFKKPRIISMLSIIQLPFIIILNVIMIPIYGVFAPIFVIGMVNISTMIVSYYFALKYLYLKK